MRYHDVERRLAALEAEDAARLERLQHRVLDQLTPEEYDCFAAICRRAPPGVMDQPTWEEFAVMQRVDALVHADAEFRPNDCLARPCPLAWEEEHQ